MHQFLESNQKLEKFCLNFFQVEVLISKWHGLSGGGHGGKQIKGQKKIFNKYIGAERILKDI